MSIPLSQMPDPSQAACLRPLLEGRDCVIVGSAPLQTKSADIADSEVAVAVNGGISSLDRAADLWVVGSKKHDSPGNPRIKPLHKVMLEQARNREAKQILFLRGPDVASEDATLATLARLHCRHGGWSVLDKPTKRWLEGAVCGRVNDKEPCSSGILAMAIALWCGASSVRLEGFSLKAGYHYLPKERPQAWWRNHVEADRRALEALASRYPTSALWNRALDQVSA